MTTTAEIGHRDIAEQIAEYHHGGTDWLPSGCEQIDEGSHRVVYVDYDSETVYKLAKDGQESANAEEHHVLTHWRHAGADWAPATHLYEVTVDDQWGNTTTCTVIAMPYLPEDGSVEHDGVVIAAAGDFNPANVHAHNGQIWLIDGAGM